MDYDLEKFFSQLKDLGCYTEEDLNDLSDCIAGKRNPNLDSRFEKESEAVSEEEIKDLRYRISKMGVPQKIKLAMFGNSTCRTLLVMDPARMIQMAVLRNPKMQENELEAFSKNPNISEAVLRGIADNRKWIQSYQIKYNLVTNPKTPTDVSLKWLAFINKTDLKNICRSKSIPQVLTAAARRKLTKD